MRRRFAALLEALITDAEVSKAILSLDIKAPRASDLQRLGAIWCPRGDLNSCTRLNISMHRSSLSRAFHFRRRRLRPKMPST
jgi:hypothetical protein